MSLILNLKQKYHNSNLFFPKYLHCCNSCGKKEYHKSDLSFFPRLSSKGKNFCNMKKKFQ